MLTSSSVPGVTLGVLWVNLWSQKKTVLGTRSVPRDAKEASPPKSPHHFGAGLEISFDVFHVAVAALLEERLRNKSKKRISHQRI